MSKALAGVGLIGNHVSCAASFINHFALVDTHNVVHGNSFVWTWRRGPSSSRLDRRGVLMFEFSRTNSHGLLCPARYVRRLLDLVEPIGTRSKCNRVYTAQWKDVRCVVAFLKSWPIHRQNYASLRAPFGRLH
ncbi:hypothetical protein HPB50_029366 [Hyalomma asiaticum]|nr:hypothetical protein HPB50_029366 [Hyalomma asiaticum]